MGGGVTGNKNGLDVLQGGLLYKSKHDKVLGLHVGINGNNQVVYGVQSYWKIK